MKKMIYQLLSYKMSSASFHSGTRSTQVAVLHFSSSGFQSLEVHANTCSVINAFSTRSYIKLGDNRKISLK